MFKLTMLALAAVVVAAPVVAETAATAQAAAPVVKRSAMIVSADGRQVGRVDNVRGGDALVIYNGRFIAVPVSTLSADGHHLTTSLKIAELGRR